MAIKKSVVLTQAAPAPFRGQPYSQAIRAGNLVFVAGQVSLHAGSGELVGRTIQEQTDKVFANLRAILEAAGSGLDQLVKTTVFLKDIRDLDGMNEVYRRHVGEQPPARSTVQVVAFPSAAALIEIDAIAVVP